MLDCQPAKLPIVANHELQIIKGLKLTKQETLLEIGREAYLPIPHQT